MNNIKSKLKEKYNIVENTIYDGDNSRIYKEFIDNVYEELKRWNEKGFIYINTEELSDDYYNDLWKIIEECNPTYKIEFEFEEDIDEDEEKHIAYIIDKGNNKFFENLINKKIENCNLLNKYGDLVITDKAIFLHDGYYE